MTGKRLHGPARECLLRVCYLSYTWRMTGEKKYFKRAEQEMLAAASFTDWNPEHFLDVAEFTLALAIGYDWLYDNLSEMSRAAIREAIIKKGLEPSLISDYTKWLSRPDNWNQVCNTGMTYGALAVWESAPDLARQIINRAIDKISLPMKSYDPDGVYNEGYGYWGYGTTFNVLFLSTMEKLFPSGFGLSGYGGFYKTAGYLSHMSGTSGLAFNYSDNISARELHPALLWFAKRLNDSSVLWDEKELIEEGLKGHSVFLPFLMIWGAGTDLSAISGPDKKMWTGKGKTPIALMRTSWTDPNAIFVGIKGGTCMVGHSHMDIGSFVMDANGVRWAMDFGMENYNSIESAGINLWSSRQESQRWQVFMYNNYAHNTLTVNNRLQLVDGAAPLTGFSQAKNFMNATFDLTPVYRNDLAQAHRGIAIVNESYVAVVDELTNLSHESTVRWTLLTSAEVNITGTNTAELEKDGKKLIIRVLEPAIGEMKTWTTTSSKSYEAKNTGTTLTGFEVRLSPGEKKTLKVLLIPENATGKVTNNIKSLKKWN